MRCLIPGRAISLWLLASLLVGESGVLATNVGIDQATCPICGEGFEVRVVFSTNNFGGQDTDFYTRAGGASPLPFYPRVCPSCFYAGYRKEFDSTAQVSADKAVDLAAKLSPCPGADPTMRPADWPSWIRYEQIYETFGLLGKPPRELADACLRASWCVREDLSGFPILPVDLLRAAYAMEDSLSRESNREDKFKASGKVAMGFEMFRAIVNSPEDHGSLHVLAALHLLRSHGENDRALTLVPMLEQHLYADIYASFRDSLRASIELERRYQRLAVRHFIEAATIVDGPDELPILYYLIGELKRRLGERVAAIEYFNKTLQQDSLTKQLGDLTRSQIALAQDSCR